MASAINSPWLKEGILKIIQYCQPKSTAQSRFCLEFIHYLLPEKMVEPGKYILIYSPN